MAMPFFDRALDVYLKANAWLANNLLHVFGQNSQLSDVTIQSPQFAIAVRRGCDAVEPTWLLCAAILSFPSPFIRKLWGMLLGIVLLQILNLIRIVTLFLIGIHLPAFFNSAHMEIWPTIFIITAITLFVGWKGWITDRVEPNATA
jgi:exosortase family protein XrtM